MPNPCRVRKLYKNNAFSLRLRVERLEDRVVLSCLATTGGFVCPVDPAATYLTAEAAAHDTVPIDLADLGIVPGDTITLEQIGDFRRGAFFSDDATDTIAVFSSSSVLLPPSGARVEGAIEAGDDVVTISDIPEDFRITPTATTLSITIQVPAGATHLFVAANDSLPYSDNTDPDGDFAVRITVAAPLVVSIDIKPGDEPNAINLNSNGMVPVALLGSDTFDVADVDLSSLAFGPGGAAPANNSIGQLSDANGDGLMDLLGHFRVQETGIGPADTQACLAGYLFDGTAFQGCDSVQIVPRGGRAGGIAAAQHALALFAPQYADAALDPAAENQSDSLQLAHTFDEQLPGAPGQYAVPSQRGPAGVAPDASVVDLAIEAIFGPSGLNVTLAEEPNL